MRNSDITRGKLIDAARTAFWEQGYSNTSLRSIAGDACVDVALISRYFGGKLGLFEATLESVFEWPELMDPNNDPIDVVVAKFAAPGTEAHAVSSIRLIIMNANDPQVGELIRDALREALFDPLEARLGGPKAAARLAMFLSVVIGAAMARNSLELPGMKGAEPEEYARQLRYMIDAALRFDEED